MLSFSCLAQSALPARPGSFPTDSEQSHRFDDEQAGQDMQRSKVYSLSQSESNGCRIGSPGFGSVLASVVQCKLYVKLKFGCSGFCGLGMSFYVSLAMEMEENNSFPCTSVVVHLTDTIIGFSEGFSRLPAMRLPGGEN